MVMSGKMQDGINVSFNKSLVMNELPSGDALKVRLGNWLLDNPVIPAKRNIRLRLRVCGALRHQLSRHVFI